MAGDEGITYVEWMVERINAHPISREDMAELVVAASSLSPEDRCFEVHAALSFQQFPGDADKSFSAMFRMMALARLVSAGNLLGWCGEPGEEGQVLTQEPIFAAAGEEPVKLNAGEIEFDRERLIQRAFQLAKSTSNRT